MHLSIPITKILHNMRSISSNYKFALQTVHRVFTGAWNTLSMFMTHVTSHIHGCSIHTTLFTVLEDHPCSRVVKRCLVHQWVRPVYTGCARGCLEHSTRVRGPWTTERGPCLRTYGPHLRPVNTDSLHQALALPLAESISPTISKKQSTCKSKQPSTCSRQVWLENAYSHPHNRGFFGILPRK